MERWCCLSGLLAERSGGVQIRQAWRLSLLGPISKQDWRRKPLGGRGEVAVSSGLFPELKAQGYPQPGSVDGRHPSRVLEQDSAAQTSLRFLVTWAQLYLPCPGYGVEIIIAIVPNAISGEMCVASHVLPVCEYVCRIASTFVNLVRKKL